MDISPVTTSNTPENNSWAQSLDWVETVTIDGAVGFVPATHFPAGVLPSGTAIGKVTASGKYGLYDEAAVDGRTVFVGLTHGDVTISATKSVGAAMLTHGQIREARLPFAVAGTAWADNPLIRRI
ncbi:MAG TPA: head decoration protein [Dermatophilaceae bacterium]